jgi:hypothetical protein
MQIPLSLWKAFKMCGKVAKIFYQVAILEQICECEILKHVKLWFHRNLVLHKL